MPPRQPGPSPPCAGHARSPLTRDRRRTPGRDLCATQDYPAGEEGEAAHAARCTQAGPGLRMLTTRDGSWAGFARRADGVMITLTGPAEDKAAFRHTRLPVRAGRSGPALAAQHQ
jgi:hypothetical protein